MTADARLGAGSRARARDGVTVIALRGHPVTLVKWTEGTAEAARAMFERATMKDIERGKITSEEAQEMLKRIAWRQAARHDLDGCDLVIEAIVEDEAEKLKCFAAIEPALKQSAILASTTSSLGIDAMARETGRPRLFLGAHFFNPP